MNNKSVLSYVLGSIIIISTILPVCLAAQQQNGEQIPNGKNHASQERIIQLKKMKLLDILALQGASADKFLVKYNEGQARIDEMRKQLNESVRAMMEATRNKASSDEITQKTDATLKLQSQYFAAITERITNLKSIVTPEQYAKLVQFEIKFPELLQKFLMKRTKNEM